MIERLIARYGVVPLAAGAAVLLGAIYFTGVLGLSRWQARHAKARTDEARAELAVAKVQIKQAKVNERVVVKYVDRIRVVREKGATLIKEVPIYVPSDSCPLPAGFRVLHDAAAQGELPNPAGIADAAAVSAQDVARTVAENYTTCHATEEQLMALQEWVVAQATAN